MWRTRILPLLLLAACGGGKSAPAPPTPTITETTIQINQYIAQNIWGTGQTQTDATVAQYRKADVGNYLGDDCILNPDGSSACLFDPGLIGTYQPALGAGGDMYILDQTSGNVRITLTECCNTGKQYFPGPECGYDGWVEFGTVVPTGGWDSMIARNPISITPGCANVTGVPLAYTQWRMEQMTWTLTLNGVALAPLTLPTVVSEHYYADSIGDSNGMERTYYAPGYGRIAWEFWSPLGAGSVDNAAETDPNFPTRCAMSPPYSVAPGAGWTKQDCRYWVSWVSSPTPNFSGASFGWLQANPP
jgi:hypothetical protein